MTARRWKAACIGATITAVLMLLAMVVGMNMRGYCAPGGELFAAEGVGIGIWWILDIRAARADKAERRRQEIMKRNRR